MSTLKRCRCAVLNVQPRMRRDRDIGSRKRGRVADKRHCAITECLQVKLRDIRSDKIAGSEVRYTSKRCAHFLHQFFAEIRSLSGDITFALYL